MLSLLVSLLISAPAPASPVLPEPDLRASVTKRSKPIGWPEGRTPQAPPGFKVTLFAKDLVNPRWLHLLKNGDVLVAEAFSRAGEAYSFARTGSLESAKRIFAEANRITLLRGGTEAGAPMVRETFVSGLNQPFGMLERDGAFLVADTDAVLSFPYQPGQTRLKGEPKKILSLPGNGYHGHWTRNLVASPDGKKILVTVGSSTNDAEDGMEQEARRADILEINPDGSGEQVYASGLRNPVGAEFYPGTGVLWTAVNERDNLGDDVPPDYLTHVEPGGFYGWPYSYFGQHVDPRQIGRRPDLVAKAIVPDFPLGAHTASLGLQFYEGDSFPARYKGGAFIGQHGSWNRSTFAGYQVVFVPFAKGVPSGPMEPFLTGFIADESKSQVYGRPVGVLMLGDGSLLVADDDGNCIWRVSAVR
jgi:glucose/arabinose dehydrogenase